MLVVLEAGITGTPVLITDQCGFEQIGGINGGLVVEASENGLENGLVQMLRNRETLKVMGNNLKIFVNKYYRWESIINKYLELYKGILVRHGYLP